MGDRRFPVLPLLLLAMTAPLVWTRPQGSPRDPDEDWFPDGSSSSPAASNIQNSSLTFLSEKLGAVLQDAGSSVSMYPHFPPARDSRDDGKGSHDTDHRDWRPRHTARGDGSGARGDPGPALWTAAGELSEAGQQLPGGEDVSDVMAKDVDPDAPYPINPPPPPRFEDGFSGSAIPPQRSQASQTSVGQASRDSSDSNRPQSDGSWQGAEDLVARDLDVDRLLLTKSQEPREQLDSTSSTKGVGPPGALSESEGPSQDTVVSDVDVDREGQPVEVGSGMGSPRRQKGPAEDVNPWEIRLWKDVALGDLDEDEEGWSASAETEEGYSDNVETEKGYMNSVETEKGYMNSVETDKGFMDSADTEDGFMDGVPVALAWQVVEAMNSRTERPQSRRHPDVAWSSYSPLLEGDDESSWVSSESDYPGDSLLFALVLQSLDVPEVHMPSRAGEDEDSERGSQAGRDIDLWQVISNFPFQMLIETRLDDDDDGDDDDDDVFEEYYEEYYDDDEDDYDDEDEDDYDDEYEDDDFDLYDDDDDDDEDLDASFEDEGKYLQDETDNESDEGFLDSDEEDCTDPDCSDDEEDEDDIIATSNNGRAGDFELSVPAMIAK